MPELSKMLSNYDFGMLRIISEKWGILLPEDKKAALKNLSQQLLDSDLIHEILDTLTAEEQTLISELLGSGGLNTLPVCERKYGSIRQMGAGRRDRERPDLHPENPLESLYYRAIIGIDFLKPGEKIEEHVFIPDEFIPYLSTNPLEQQFSVNAVDIPSDQKFLDRRDHILDDLTTLLAGLRIGYSLSEIPFINEIHGVPFQESLMISMGLFDREYRMEINRIQTFLENERQTAMQSVLKNWCSSSLINELQLLPGLEFEGNWKNDVVKTRTNVLDLLKILPPEKTFILDQFIDSVYRFKPDFQRSGGDYQSWFIKDSKSGTYLSGFEAWHQVEGRLLRYFIRGPLYWLGLCKLGHFPHDQKQIVFQLHPQFDNMLDHTGIPIQKEELSGTILVQPDGKTKIERNASRTARYQISRFTDWLKADKGSYLYQINADSLQRAAEQGLKGHHLLQLLKKHSNQVVPPGITDALYNWDEKGIEVSIRPMVILHFQNKDLVKEVMQSSLKQYIISQMNETTLAIKKGTESFFEKEILRRGYLIQIKKE